MNKLILIAGGSTLVYAGAGGAHGRAARHPVVEHAARPRSQPADGVAGRRSRRLRGQRLQLLPHPAGTPAGSGQGVWPTISARRLRVPDTGAARFSTYGTGFDQHRRTPAE